MSAHAITIHLPETLYNRFRQRAEWSHRSLETEILDAVASAASVGDELSPELIEAVEGLEKLDDEQLWLLARTAISPEASQELEALHARQRDEGLSPAKDATRAKLIHEYERIMLIRAQAAMLLKNRGHDVSRLLATQVSSAQVPRPGFTPGSFAPEEPLGAPALPGPPSLPPGG